MLNYLLKSSIINIRNIYSFEYNVNSRKILGY